MKVLKATQAQYDLLDGYANGNHKLKFTKDGNDNWIVGKAVLYDSNFAAIHNDLQTLVEIDYVAPEIPNDP